MVFLAKSPEESRCSFLAASDLYSCFVSRKTVLHPCSHDCMCKVLKQLFPQVANIHGRYIGTCIRWRANEPSSMHGLLIPGYCTMDVTPDNFAITCPTDYMFNLSVVNSDTAKKKKIIKSVDMNM